MVLPSWLERILLKYAEPIISPIARRLPFVSVIRHRGRTTGSVYQTPVTTYRKGDVIAINLVHGKTNWVRNVLAAGEADVRESGADVHIKNPRILAVGSDGVGLPRQAQRALKRCGVFVADIV